MVGAGQSRCAAPRILRLGAAHRTPVATGRQSINWALYDREPLPTWTKGRLSLLGDAAHPMLPHLGQGANQSIEDGMALATILARVDRASAPAALLAYERLRRGRRGRRTAWRAQNGLRYNSAYSDLDLRDAELAAHAEFTLRPRRGAGRASRRNRPHVKKHFASCVTMHKQNLVRKYPLCRCRHLRTAHL